MVKKIQYRWFYGILILGYALYSFLGSEFNFVYLYVITILLFLRIIKYIPNYVRQHKVYKVFLIYFIYSLFTIVYAENIQLSFSYLSTYIANFLILTIFCVFYENRSYRNFVYLFFVIYLICSWIFGGYHIDATNARFENVVNANRFSDLLLILLFIIYYLGEKYSNKQIFKYLFLLIPVLVILVATRTGSRQAILVNMFLFLCLLFKRYFLRKNIFYVIAFILICILLFPAIKFFVQNQLSGSLLQERLAEDIKEDSRIYLLRTAIQVGNEHPLFGVGLSNFKLYSNGTISHCSYAEAYAEGGIIALLLYLMMFVVFFKNQIVRYKKSKDNKFITFIIFGIAYFIASYFYVFQSSFVRILMIMLVEQESLSLFKCYQNKKIVR